MQLEESYDEVDQSFDKPQRRRRRRRRGRKNAGSSSSENSDGEDASSSCMASRTSDDGLTGDGSSEFLGVEVSSASTDVAPEFGSPDYWDYKRAQLKLMVADRKKSGVITVQNSSQRKEDFRLGNLRLNREVSLTAGGTSRAYLTTNQVPFIDMNLSISCPDLNIIPSMVRLLRGQDKTSTFLFRASKTCASGAKVLKVAVGDQAYKVCGISVVEAIESLTLSEDPCVLNFGDKKSGLTLTLNQPVVKDPLRVVFESNQLSISPSKFILNPGSTIVGPFTISCLSSAQSGSANLSVLLSSCTTQSQINLPSDPLRIELSSIMIARPITSALFDPLPERILPGSMFKAKIKVDHPPSRDTLLNITSEDSTISLSVSRLILRSGETHTDAVILQISNDAKFGTYPVTISFLSCRKGAEKRVDINVDLTIHGPKNLRLDDVSESSDVESYSPSSVSSPHQRIKQDDVSLAQLRHLLKDLLEQRPRLQGPNHRRERTRVKRRIKAIQGRIKDVEESERKEAQATKPEKRDPHRTQAFSLPSQRTKRDPAKQSTQPATIFQRRRMSLPVNHFDPEESELQVRSEAFPSRSRPPISSPKQPAAFNLSPKVFSEMMDLPVQRWNRQHVCCWLHSLGMGYRKYTRLFYSTNVDGKQLLTFGKDELLNIGVYSEPHRKRIIEDLKSLSISTTKKNATNELKNKNNNVTNVPKQSLVNPSQPPSKTKRPPNSKQKSESNPLFTIADNLTPAEINNQIRELREYSTKLKSKRKRNKRLRCMDTIRKLEKLLSNTSDNSTVTQKATPPLSISPPANVHKEKDVFKDNQFRSPFAPAGAAQQTHQEERAFKTPRSSKEAFKFQERLFKKDDSSAFGTLRRQRANSNNDDNSDTTESVHYETEVKRFTRRTVSLSSERGFRDTASMSSMSLSELEDSEEFNAHLFRQINDVSIKDDASITSENSVEYDRAFGAEFADEDEDSSEMELDISEISYGTPGYWAFKRRQLQEMASKRKRRLRLRMLLMPPVQDFKDGTSDQQHKVKQQKKKPEKSSLDDLLHQLQTRLQFLTKQKKSGSHGRRFRSKINKQMATIQKRINQLHQAKRMRNRRLLDAQQKRRLEKGMGIVADPTLKDIILDVDVTDSVVEERKEEPVKERLDVFLDPIEPKEPTQKPIQKTEKIVQKKESARLSEVVKEVPEKKEKTAPVPALKTKIDTSLSPRKAKTPDFSLLLSPSSGMLNMRERRGKESPPQIPATPSTYASAGYWNDRYSTKKSCEEWYEDYQQFQHVIERFLSPMHLVLDLGCGDSAVQDRLRERGFEVLACDISNIVLQRLAGKKREMITADAYNLPFTNSSFDVILDKGTLDALSCDKSRDLPRLFKEIHRILRPNGRYICVTPWNAPKRLPQLSSVHWAIQHEVIPMSLQTIATQRFNQLNDHPQLGRDKDTLMAMSYRQAAEQLEKMNLDEEKLKRPGQSCVLHVYICTKGRMSLV